MRKLFFFAILSIAALGASAAVSTSQVRIYINPGHGSWTSNDRPCGTVKHGANNPSAAGSDTAGFFESNTNLLKGFAMLEKLVEYGVPFDRTKNQSNSNPARVGAALDLSQNIVMSHVKAGPYPTILMGGDANSANAYNRTLSEVAAEVEMNNFDVFMSIHSNANNEGDVINYPLIIYRGTDSEEGNAGSKAMGQAVWPHLYGAGMPHQQWTATGTYSMTKMNIRGDMTFYGKQSSVTYDVTDPNYQFDTTDKFVEYDEDASKVTFTGHLGAIKHGVPGFLAEGYFHTYQPARHRYMNDDVCALEGEAYAKGINDYFGWGKTESTGTIYGIVRDKHNKFSHTYYTPGGGTADMYKPLNDVEVKLKDGNGNVVATYKTDDEYNGVFMFKKVQPGNYSLEFSHPEYLSDLTFTSYTAEVASKINVTVSADALSCPTVFMQNVAYVPAESFDNYPDPLKGNSTFKPASSYTLESSTSNLLASQLSGKTVRRQIVRDDKLYVLALNNANEPYIYLADIKAGTVKTLDMSAVTLSKNGRLKISDIALTADNALIASGMTVTYSDAGQIQGSDVYNGVLNFYKWTQNSTTKLPETCQLWFTTSYFCNWYRCLIGKTLTYSGTLEDGNIVTTGQTNTGQIFRIAKFGISDSKKVSEMRFNGNADATSKAIFAANAMSTNGDFELMVSPLDPNNYVFDGNACAAFEWTGTTDNSTPQKIGANTIPNVKSNGANYFKFAGKSLMVTPNIDSDGKVCGVQLFDITSGFSSAKQITLTGANITATNYTYASAHGRVVTTEANGAITAANVELYLVVDGVVYKFTEPEPVIEDFITVTPATGTANPYAYALKGEVDESTLKISYSLNANATDVSIVIKDENGVEYDVIEQGAQAKGAHSAEISISDYDAGKYDWEIVVDGAEKTTVEEFAAYKFNHPRGVDVDINMESGSFGNVYVTDGQLATDSKFWSVTGGGIGLYAFSADMQPITNPATGNYAFTGGWTLNQKIGTSNGADFARVRVAEDGRLFVTRMSNAGNYIMYAPTFEDLLVNNKFTSLFGGFTLDATTYKYTNANGTFMAASNLGFDVKGSGKDLKMVALSSNNSHWSYVYGGASTDQYALGTAATLPVPTNVPALTGKYTIAPQATNVDYDNRGGIWYCQYRGNPTNEQPGLVYIDANGTEKYKDLVCRGGGGVRVSPDGTKIAIASSGVDPKQFTIYGLTWSESSVPTLSREIVITHGIGTNVYDIAWDLAGNIYICGNTGEFLKGFSLPRNKAFTTKAPSQYSFSVIANSIDGISVDSEDAPVEYYNLQGVKVENPSNGVFIKVQGNKTEKVYIK